MQNGLPGTKNQMRVLHLSRLKRYVSSVAEVLFESPRGSFWILTYRRAEAENEWLYKGWSYALVTCRVKGTNIRVMYSLAPCDNIFYGRKLDQSLANYRTNESHGSETIFAGGLWGY